MASVKGAVRGTGHTLAGIAKVVNLVQQGAMTSLPEYVKDTIVSNRLYVEDTLVNEEITENLATFLNQMCIGYILVALNMQNYISSTRSVRDLLSVVATESYVDIVSDVDKYFGDLDAPIVSMEASVITLEPKAQKLFAGRVIEVNITVPGGTDGKVQQVPVILYVQLVPYILTSETMRGFINLNLQLPTHIRRLQAKSGSIRYLKDYIMAVDLLKKEQKAIVNDRSGVLAGLVRKKHSSLSTWVKGNIKFLAGGERHANSANTLVVMSDITFSETCRSLNLNFNNTAVRNKFFKESFTMMLVIVDSMYNLVKIYFSGLDEVGEYTFNAISKGADTQGKDDSLKDIVTSLARNNLPRY